MLTIILSIVGGIVVLIVLWAIIARIYGKKKEHALDENIKKMKAEKENLSDGGVLSIASEDEIKDLFVPEESEVKSVDLELQSEENQQSHERKMMDDFDIASDNSFKEFFGDLDEEFGFENKKTHKKHKNHDDFEKFLDKHSYTRRILDKSILKKLQDLPPELKAVVISNIFTRPQD